MRAYVKAGLQILNEEKYKDHGDRTSMNVRGTTKPIAGELNNFHVFPGDYSSALDWDQAFMSFDASRMHREEGREIFTAPKSEDKKDRTQSRDKISSHSPREKV